jgi:hypothetical protein
MVTATQTSPPPGWLKDETFDLSFTIGILLLAVAVVSVGAQSDGLFYLLVVADLWLLGYHHVISTFTKLAGTADDRRQHRALIWYLLPAVMIGTFVLGKLWGVVAIVTLYFFWQWFHYVRQSWGIAQRYRRQAGGLAWDEPRLAEVTLWAVPAWGLLHRCNQQPTTFLGMPIWLPPVPLIAVQAAGVIACALVGWWLVTRLRAARRGELTAGHSLFMGTHFVVFAGGYLLFDDISLGWLMVNVWHNAQYVAFVWLFTRQRFSSGVSPRGIVLSWLSQPGVGRAIAYYGACIAVSTVVYLGLGRAYLVVAGLSDAVITSVNFLILFSMGLNFHHYVVDGIIWKRKRQVQPAAIAV